MFVNLSRETGSRVRLVMKLTPKLTPKTARKRDLSCVQRWFALWELPPLSAGKSSLTSVMWIWRELNITCASLKTKWESIGKAPARLATGYSPKRIHRGVVIALNYTAITELRIKLRNFFRKLRESFRSFLSLEWPKICKIRQWKYQKYVK